MGNKVLFVQHQRLEHYKKPPNLLSPGVFNFRQPTSTNYYFHNEVISFDKFC